MCITQLVPPSPCSLDKAHYRAKCRGYGRMNIYILVESTSLDPSLYCLKTLYECLYLRIGLVLK